MTGSASETRRVGVAAALRNCCVDDAGRSARWRLWRGRLLRRRRRREGDRRRRVRQGRRERRHGGWSGGGARAAPTHQRRQNGARAMRRSETIVRGGVVGAAGSDAGRAALGACDAPRLLKVGYGDEEHPETMEAMEAAAEKFMLHGMVPAEKRRRTASARGGGGRRRGRRCPRGEEKRRWRWFKEDHDRSYPGRGLKRWQWDGRARRGARTQYQGKEIPAVEMSQKFYWTKCGAFSLRTHIFSPVKHDEDRRAFPWRRRLFRVVPRGRPRRADRTMSGKMSTELGSDPAGGGGVHGHLKLNKGNFRCVSARSFMRFHNRVSQSPPRVIWRSLPRLIPIPRTPPPRFPFFRSATDPYTSHLAPR